MQIGLALMLPLAVSVLGDPARDPKKGFREKVRCIENGKFYRNPNTHKELAFRKKECAEYYLCIEGEVFPFKCSTGLTFDIKRQICDRSVSEVWYAMKPRADSKC